MNISAVRPPAPPSAGTSTPASVAASGSRTASPKSGTTNPFQPVPLSASITAGLSHAWVPLTRLYEHITPSALLSSSAMWNGRS